MDLVSAARTAQDLMTLHGLPAGGWRFGWNRGRRVLGLCRYRERLIELSAHFVLRNDAPAVRDVILHEIAHALAGADAGHGPRWRAECLRIGAKPERCAREVAMPAGRWRGLCGGCGETHHRHRRPATGASYYCTRCGPKVGKLTFAAA